MKHGWLIWESPYSGWTKSWSRPGTRHHFYVAPDGEFIDCTCEAFRFRNSERRPCKHLSDAIQHIIRRNNAAKESRREKHG